MILEKNGSILENLEDIHYGTTEFLDGGFARPYISVIFVTF